MVTDVMSKISINREKVIVAGLSAGAAMTAILGATYPDIFKAIGVGSGLEYKVASSMTGAIIAMLKGGPNPSTQGREAYNSMGKYKTVVPTIIFHGTADTIVSITNCNQILSQWAKTNDLADDGKANDSINDIPDEIIYGQVPQGRNYTRYIYYDSSQQIVMEKYIGDDMGHAWSGGALGENYTDPTGPNQSQIFWDFFNRVSNKK